MPFLSPDLPASYRFILASGSPRRRELLEMLGLPFAVVLPESNQPSISKGAITSHHTTPGRKIHSPALPQVRVGGRRSAVGDRIYEGGLDETPLPGETPAALVQRLSRAKARAVAARLTSSISPELHPATKLEAQTTIIIAADTVVVSADKILGKPANPDGAIQMLKQLRQQRYHDVYSGLTVGILPGQVGDALGSDRRPTDRSDLQLLTRLHQSRVWMRPYTDAEIETYVASGDPLDKAGAYAIQNRAFAPVERLDGCFASVMGLPLGELATALSDIGLSLPAIAPLCSRYTGHPCCQ